MKYSVAILFAAAAALVNAQFDGLPTCAQTCAMSGMNANSSGCKTGDIKCICSDKNFMETINSCIQTVCSKADQEKTITFAEALCKKAGAEIPSSVISSLTAHETAPASASASGSGHHASATATSTGGASATASKPPTASSTSGAAGKVVPGLGLGAAAAALFLL
ncbi:hypothetical protein FN846DRAFT_950453 [Sphaerosporella brunnea]|uniref:CFEM domain-containing protein n=1 Tax=Sphaerosporella brunnea TaxID=1250544 RepID=A0A5J5EX77_9PEZI|nr:hypothetical protein FN846DRAFT_950453 [Sphaerosporella brunnea]